MSGSILILTAVLIAVVPTAVYVFCLWLIDPYEREPVSDLGIMLLAGALIAPLIATLVESAAGLPNSISPQMFQIFPVLPPNIWAGAVEEGAKALVVLAAFVLLRREFDDTLDGLVYGAAVGAGFALAQSVVYLRELAPLSGAASLNPGFFFAILLTGFSQCFFTSLFGASLGYTREAAPKQWLIPLAGFVVAAVYHMAYTGLGYLASAPGSRMEGALAGLARRGADWLGLLLLIFMVRWAWERERYIFSRTLTDEIQTGALTKDEVGFFVAGERMARQLGAWRRAGWNHYAAVRRLHRAQAELAFAKWRLQRGLGADDDVARRREEIRRLRRAAEASAR